MMQPYVGEIKMFAGSSAPAGWMLCNGQLLPVAENHFLFRLIGATYGGDGRATFALPDLRQSLPVHQEEGPAGGERPFTKEEPFLCVNYIISLYGIFSPAN
jgi:microcystin-dependent protein